MIHAGCGHLGENVGRGERACFNPFCDFNENGHKDLRNSEINMIL